MHNMNIATAKVTAADAKPSIKPLTRLSSSLQSPSKTVKKSSSSNISTTSSSSSSSSASMTTSPILKPNIIRTNHQVRNKFFRKIGIVDGTPPPRSGRAVIGSASFPASEHHHHHHHQHQHRHNQQQTAVNSIDSTIIPSRDLQNVARFSEPLKYNRREERIRQERKAVSMFASDWTKPNTAFGTLISLNNEFKNASRNNNNNNNNNITNRNSNEGGTMKKKKNDKKKRITFEESVMVVPIPMRSEYSDRIRSRLWSNAMEIYENAARNSVEFAAENWDWRNAYNDEEMCICCVTGDLIHPVHYGVISKQIPIVFGSGSAGN